MPSWIVYFKTESTSGMQSQEFSLRSQGMLLVNNRLVTSYFPDVPPAHVFKLLFSTEGNRMTSSYTALFLII